MSSNSTDRDVEELDDPMLGQQHSEEINQQEEIASQIRAFRKKRRMSQMELAKRIRLKQSAVSRIEQGEHANWTYGTLKRVADALDAHWLMILEDKPRPEEERFESNQDTEYLAAARTDISPVQEQTFLQSDPNFSRQVVAAMAKIKLAKNITVEIDRGFIVNFLKQTVVESASTLLPNGINLSFVIRYQYSMEDKTDLETEDAGPEAFPVQYVETAVIKYASLVGQKPTAFLDASKLPVPKSRMKKFLKHFWVRHPDCYKSIEIAYTHLANFREGLGPEPIDRQIPANASAEIVTKILDTWWSWAYPVQAEADDLLTEFKNFKNLVKFERKPPGVTSE